MIYEMFLVYGVWRSLVARTAGGREVAGSNPVTPIFCRRYAEFAGCVGMYVLITFDYFLKNERKGVFRTASMTGFENLHML